MPLYLGIAVAAAGVERIVHLGAAAELQRADGAVLGASLGVAMAAMTCIAATGPRLHRRTRILMSHLGIAAAIVVGLAGPAITPVVLVMALTALCAAQLRLAMSYSLQPTIL